MQLSHAGDTYVVKSISAPVPGITISSSENQKRQQQQQQQQAS
jgi:hypothetical protein